MSPHPITIAARFAGPPRSGNGGYTAGLLASLMADTPAVAGGPVQVTLRKPPPLETALEVAQQPGLTQLLTAGELVAEATAGSFKSDPVPAVSIEEALAAQPSYAGLGDHPFPTCFVCGTDRQPGDGLRLTPGLTRPGHSACVWSPHASLGDAQTPTRVSSEFVWAALDCPGGWTSDLHARPLVLGRMTAQVSSLPSIESPLVMVGSLLGVEGRKTLTATTLYDSDGSTVGRAEHVWIAIDPRDFFAG